MREKRLKLGLSQEELGFRCDLDRTYISGIERGTRNPTIWALLRVARGLDTKPSDLLKRAERQS